MALRPKGMSQLSPKDTRPEIGLLSADMDDRRQLATQTILFGKVIVYECTVCRKKFAMPLLEGAVPSDHPPPLTVARAFLIHACGAAQESEGKFSMTSDDEDIPASYLLYVVAALAAIAAIAISGFILWFR
jgi:hypothetical protein